METVLIPVPKKISRLKTKYPTVKYLLVAFNLPMQESNIRQFREDVISCIADEKEREVFSNEVWRDGKCVEKLNGYPLLQYRVFRGMAAIFALQTAVPLLEKFLAEYCNAKSPKLFFRYNPHFCLQVMHREKENNFVVNIFNQQFRLQPTIYRLHTWLPLNRDNYKWWKENRNAADIAKTAKLEQIMLSQLCEFIHYMGGYIPRRKIKLSILDKDRLKKIRYDDLGQVAFDVRYSVNLELPPYISLGNHRAFGFGWQRLED